MGWCGRMDGWGLKWFGVVEYWYDRKWFLSFCLEGGGGCFGNGG